MKLKPWHFYIWIASALVFILLIAGLSKEVPPLASKISVIYDKAKPVPFKSFKPFACTGKTVFACTVKYLHYLRYLPISRTGTHRYEFSFPVPEVLRNVADSYAWNSQNPFVLGAAAQYLEVSGGLRDGEYAKPEINAILLSKLKKSAANGEFDSHPWKWVLVRQAMKGERAELYENGRKVFSSPANTGEFTTTPDGTWYVYLRFRNTTMSGLSPSRISEKVYESLKLKDPNKVRCLDGHPVKWVAYDDSGIKYVDYFNRGIALHYIYRLHYGFPQSAGCVELPHRNAEFLYNNIGYGTIVTVVGIAEHAAAKKPGDTNAAASEACTQPVPQPGRLKAGQNKN
ncbi:MAG: L,D-transpeptidase [bacterium]